MPVASIDFPEEHTQRTARRGRLAWRFRRDESGVTAIEFGIVALPFFALIFAILETSLVFFAGQTLETAVATSSRLIRTGPAQQQKLTSATFKNEICKQILSLFDCSNHLVVTVKTITGFGSIDYTVPKDSKGNVKDPLLYTPGKSGELVVVQAFYSWPVIAGLLGFDLASQPNGTHLLSSTAAFRNEPFPW